MMFVYPAFLWALLAVSIPIIIHLFNFRRYKKVYFSNVRFLKEIQHESKSKSRLKEILVLISRCLAIAAMVIAFAQPVLTNKQSGLNRGTNAVSIYVDNSFSMENVQKQGPLLQIAKLRAKEIVKAFGSADKFQIITNDFEGKHQRFFSKDDASGIIDEIKISPAVKPISMVIRRQSEFLRTANNSNRRIFSLTDAQKSTTDLEKLNNDSTIKITLLPIEANKVNNVYIDSCWFETPLQQKGFIQKLHATVVNKGNEAISAGSAKLFLNKQQQALSSFTLEANSKTEIKFTFECKESGFNFGSVRIEDYPITFDDELFFAFNSQVSIGVTLINGKDFKSANYFESLLKSDSLFRLTTLNEQAIDYTTFKNSDVIILNELSEISSGLLSELEKFAGNGGSILFVPSDNGNISTYNNFLSILRIPVFQSLDTARLNVDKIDASNTFYSGVFEKIEERINLPVINKHFLNIRNNRSDFETILKLQNGDAFLTSVKYKSGNLYVSNAPFNPAAGNISKHALFVPTIYRIAFNSLKPTPLSYEVNANAVINLKTEGTTNDKPFRISETSKKAEIIPEARVVNNSLTLFTRGQITIPGFYEVSRDDEKFLPLAFNYSRKESDLNCYTVEELKQIISDKLMSAVSIFENSGDDISQELLEDTQGKKLWKLFIILALTFLLIEILLLRFLK